MDFSAQTSLFQQGGHDFLDVKLSEDASHFCRAHWVVRDMRYMKPCVG